MIKTKCGFVAILGRPNSGKSFLINAMANENIMLVSNKFNATRKRMNIVVMHNETQIIFMDTPGIHQKEKLLNKFMLDETMKAMYDCDIAIFVASLMDDIKHYEEFLEMNNKKHILVLSKIDRYSREQIYKQINLYNKYKDKYESIIPVSSKNNINIKNLINEVAKYIPRSQYLYDIDIISTNNIREIYKEKIREAIFNRIHKEIPYESCVDIKSLKETKSIDIIKANIIVEKNSQKIILIGKNGNTIKSIGMQARRSIEQFSRKKAFLELNVIIKKGWSKDKNMIELYN